MPLTRGVRLCRPESPPVTNGKTKIALDLSCAAEFPITGIGYTALYQVKALLAQSATFDFRVFATGDRQGKEILHRELNTSPRPVVLHYARLLKYGLWTRFNWPPIEWFTGAVQIAHNLAHQTPATRNAARLVTIHDLSFLRVPETHTERTVEIQSRLLRQCARDADGLIAVSQHCKRELMALLNVPPERIHVILNGVNLEEFDVPFDTEAFTALRSRLGITRDYLIHLGTIEPRKNVPRLLDAYTRVKKQLGEAPQLVFIGKRGWKSQSIIEAIQSRSPQGDVIYGGYVTRKEAVLLLRGAKVSLYPSLYEGFGLPVLEAMAARTPVVTSNVSSLPEVAGNTCSLVNPEEVESIAGAMATLLTDEQSARRRTEAARKRAESMTWEQSAAALEAVYTAVAS